MYMYLCDCRKRELHDIFDDIRIKKENKTIQYDTYLFSETA